MGGDGMQIAIDTDNDIVYTGYQFGNYFRINKQKDEFVSIKPKHNLGESPLRFNWQTPIQLSSHNNSILYLGSNKLHRSMKKGENFKLEQLPKQNQSLEAHEKLYKKYRNKPFTKLDAQVYLRKSKTTIRRYFIDLKQLELLDKINQKKQFRDLYQVKRKPIIYQEKETRTVFEQAFEEWEDYNGWIDLTHRT